MLTVRGLYLVRITSCTCNFIHRLFGLQISFNVVLRVCFHPTSIIWYVAEPDVVCNLFGVGQYFPLSNAGSLILQKSINITVDNKCRLFQNLNGALGKFYMHACIIYDSEYIFGVVFKMTQKTDCSLQKREQPCQEGEGREA